MRPIAHSIRRSSIESGAKKAFPIGLDMAAFDYRHSRRVGTAHLSANGGPCPPYMIRSDADHSAALKVLAPLMGQHRSTDEDDYFAALVLLIKDYETRRHKIDIRRSSPVEILKYLVEESGMTVNDLGRIIGSQPNASLIFSGKRAMSKAHIAKLSAHFAVSPALFFAG